MTVIRSAISLQLLMAIVVGGCQPSSETSTPTPGQTTLTRGTPVTRSETTRASDSNRGAQTAEVTLMLDRATYASGANVTMRLRHTGRDTLGYNPCSNRTVERQDGASWTAQPEPNRMCTMELRLLNPGETQSVMTDLPSPLSSGSYRIVLLLSRQTAAGGTVRAVSAPFTIR